MSNTPAQTEQSQPINLFELPNTYVNGFTYHATLGDVMLVLQTNGRPVGTLNMSFTVAKTLAHKLGEMVQQFQERSGRTLLTLDEVADNLRQAHEDARDVAAVADAAQKPRRNGHAKRAA